MEEREVTKGSKGRIAVGRKVVVNSPEISVQTWRSPEEDEEDDQLTECWEELDPLLLMNQRRKTSMETR